MGVCSAVTPLFDIQTYRIRFIDPVADTDRKCMKTGLLFKVVEFDHFKLTVINLLPRSQVFQCDTVSEPVLYNIRRPGITSLGCRHIRNADIVIGIPG